MLGRKRGALITVAGVVAACLMSLTASAVEDHSNAGGAFLRAGVGPRYLAMGKAGTSLANDVNAGYWNPAGLAWMRGWQVGAMYTGGLDFDRNYNHVGVGYGAEGGSIALNWINAGTSELDGRDVSGNPTGEFDFGENAILLSLARSWEDFAFGVTGKMINQDVGTEAGVEDDNITGWGLDLGGSFRLNRYVNLGVVAQDIYTVVGDDDEANEVPSQLRFGATLFPADGFSLAADLDKVRNEEDFKFRGGAEYMFWLNDDLNASVRAGIDRTRFAGGLGLGIDWFNFDYAYVVEPENFEGTNHRLGVLLKFGGEEVPRGPGGVADRDRDGIPDDVDKCPDQAEDFDGFQDTDGCPDLDNDADGTPDVQDQCPGQAEDLDGFEDSDGCPDLDNDKDGILDKDDKCPNSAETFNGFEDTDGCPDDAPIVFPLAYINFKFGTAEISGADPIPVLEEVVRIMNQHPEITVEVQGHTDNVGSDEFNQNLSERRSGAVKDYLVRRGIASERLMTRGFGESRPIDSNDTDLGRARNRRTEFIVVKK